jgi:hypothetical protein
MICTLAFIAFGQAFINGSGNWLYKACHYDCGVRRFGYYDRIYRISPEYNCPKELRDD